MTEKKDVYSEKLNVCWDDKSACIYDEKTGDYVAEVFGKDEEKWPRAHLIAAAPELLKALDALMFAIRGYFGWDGGDIDGPEHPVAYFIGEYRAAETAIRKAKGEDND